VQSHLVSNPPEGTPQLFLVSLPLDGVGSCSYSIAALSQFVAFGFRLLAPSAKSRIFSLSCISSDMAASKLMDLFQFLYYTHYRFFHQ
jgi:hypothetical protein